MDEIEGFEVTMIDNGMPCVVMRASDLGISGQEAPESLEANHSLRAKLEAIRLKAGTLMNLGDITEKTVPKMTMVSPPTHGGAISTRTFIPHRCHASIGVLGAVSVATACLLAASPAHALATIPTGQTKTMSIEHPIGETTVVAQTDEAGEIENQAVDRHGRRKMIARDKSGDQRQSRRLIDPDHSAIQSDNRDEKRHGHQAACRQPRENERQRHVDALADGQKPPSVEAIGKHPAEGTDHQRRCQIGKGHQSQNGAGMA